MSVVHAGPALFNTQDPRCCSWRYSWEDVTLWCSDTPIPGGALCAAHYIEWVQARAERVTVEAVTLGVAS